MCWWEMVAFLSVTRLMFRARRYEMLLDVMSRCVSGHYIPVRTK